MLIDRKSYEDRLDAQLAEWGAHLETLKAKARTLSVDGMIKYDQTVEALQAKHVEAGVHLRALREAGDDTWEHVKAGTERAWAELKALFTRSSGPQ